MTQVATGTPFLPATGVPADPVQLAIVGAGAIADLHLCAIEGRPDILALGAVIDPRVDATDRTVARFPSTAAFRSIADFLAGSSNIGGVIVATPHFLHAEQVAQLAEAGLPVLVEKPLAISTAQLRSIREIADKESTIVLAGQTRRFEPEMQWAKALIKGDETSFGRLLNFNLQALQNIYAYVVEVGSKHWLLDGDLAGGGVGISLAIHQLDLVRFLSGSDFTEVAAYAKYESPFINGAESQLSAMLKLSNGAIGTLQASYTADRIPFAEAMTLIGEFGTFTQHAAALGDYRGPLSFASSHGQAPTEFATQLRGWAPVTAPFGFVALDDLSFTNQLVHFANVIRGIEAPLNSIEENFNTIACVEALVASARSGRPVTVSTW